MSNQFTNDLDDYLQEVVYPSLYERLGVAFPEFGFKKNGRNQTATQWPPSFPIQVDNPRPERLMVYFDRPYRIIVHGHGSIRFLDLLNDGHRPTGAEFLKCVKKLCQSAGVRYPAQNIPPEHVEAVAMAEVRRSILDGLMSYAQGCLWSPQGKPARDYLRERGFKEDDIRSLGLGLYGTVAKVEKMLADTGHDLNVARDAGVLWDTLEGYILVPWADDYGRPMHRTLGLSFLPMTLKRLERYG